jgi:hypothetical protein
MSSFENDIEILIALVTENNDQHTFIDKLRESKSDFELVGSLKDDDVDDSEFDFVSFQKKKKPRKNEQEKKKEEVKQFIIASKKALEFILSIYEDDDNNTDICQPDEIYRRIKKCIDNNLLKKEFDQLVQFSFQKLKKKEQCENEMINASMLNLIGLLIQSHNSGDKSIAEIFFRASATMGNFDAMKQMTSFNVFDLDDWVEKVDLVKKNIGYF